MLFVTATTIAQLKDSVLQQILKIDTAYQQDPSIETKKLLMPIALQCKNAGDVRNEYNAWLYIARDIPVNPKNNIFRLECYQQALDLIRKLNDLQEELEINRQIADIYLQQQSFVSAEHELFQIINNPKASDHNLMLATDLLSSVYSYSGKYDKSLFYALKTVKTMRGADTIYALTFYDRLAVIYFDLNNPKSSLHWSKKAYECARRIKNISLMSIIRTTIVINLIDLGRPKEALLLVKADIEKFPSNDPSIRRDNISQLAMCYEALKLFKLADNRNQEIIGMVKNPENHFSLHEQAVSYHHVGKYYLIRKRLFAAKTLLLEALKGYKKSGNETEKKNVYLLLFKADSAMKHNESAISWLQQNIRIKDSIFNDSKNKQIEELQIAYNSEQKDKKIHDLNNSAKVQFLNLKQAESTRNWIIAISIMLLVIAGLLFRQARVTKRTNHTMARKNNMLEQLVTEKEWLLKEIHHRVKNNLHTVISLLETQAKYLHGDALKAMQNSQHRIFAMSLIHQKLYRSDDIKTINMGEYIPELVHNLETSFGVTNHISFKFDITPITLNISYAIPLSLIINEAVTNAIKYAFPDRYRNEIHISLFWDEEQVKLRISDNGIGFLNDPYESANHSLGIELMKGLCSDIDATISFEIANGTAVIVSFNPNLEL
ncbi:hypothetical protein GCM10023149_24930 [Mucilaginibacter gynuensis]|uniref:histidine kinase n=1 Tax=Mucilaginibacter gynuensis TaxID=1302236 RepID=A0ABP8GG80_9SPHI